MTTDSGENRVETMTTLPTPEEVAAEWMRENVYLYEAQSLTKLLERERAQMKAAFLQEIEATIGDWMPELIIPKAGDDEGAADSYNMANNVITVLVNLGMGVIGSGGGEAMKWYDRVMREDGDETEWVEVRGEEEERGDE